MLSLPRAPRLGFGAHTAASSCAFVGRRNMDSTIAKEVEKAKDAEKEKWTAEIKALEKRHQHQLEDHQLEAQRERKSAEEQAAERAKVRGHEREQYLIAPSR